MGDDDFDDDFEMALTQQDLVQLVSADTPDAPAETDSLQKKVEQLERERLRLQGEASLLRDQLANEVATREVAVNDVTKRLETEAASHKRELDKLKSQLQFKEQELSTASQSQTTGKSTRAFRAFPEERQYPLSVSKAAATANSPVEPAPKRRSDGEDSARNGDGKQDRKFPGSSVAEEARRRKLLNSRITRKPPRVNIHSRLVCEEDGVMEAQEQFVVTGVSSLIQRLANAGDRANDVEEASKEVSGCCCAKRDSTCDELEVPASRLNRIRRLLNCYQRFVTLFTRSDSDNKRDWLRAVLRSASDCQLANQIARLVSVSLDYLLRFPHNCIPAQFFTLNSVDVIPSIIRMKTENLCAIEVSGFWFDPLVCEISDKCVELLSSWVSLLNNEDHLENLRLMLTGSSLLKCFSYDLNSSNSASLINCYSLLHLFHTCLVHLPLSCFCTQQFCVVKCLLSFFMCKKTQPVATLNLATSVVNTLMSIKGWPDETLERFVSTSCTHSAIVDIVCDWALAAAAAAAWPRADESDHEESSLRKTVVCACVELVACLHSRAPAALIEAPCSRKPLLHLTTHVLENQSSYPPGVLEEASALRQPLAELVAVFNA